MKRTYRESSTFIVVSKVESTPSEQKLTYESKDLDSQVVVKLECISDDTTASHAIVHSKNLLEIEDHKGMYVVNKNSVLTYFSTKNS